MCDSDVDFENEKDPLVISSLVLVTLLVTQTFSHANWEVAHTSFTNTHKFSIALLLTYSITSSQGNRKTGDLYLLSSINRHKGWKSLFQTQKDCF